MNKLLIAAALLIIISCTSAEKKDKQPADSTANANTVTNTTIPQTQTSSDSVEVPPFDIQLQLSDKAEKTLRQKKETVIVMAYFLGIPKDTTSKEYMESGEKGLGSRSIELTTGRTAKFSGVKVAKKDIEQLKDPDYDVLVNIYSGRRSSENNLLDCEIIEDAISKVKGKTHVLKGKMIGE